MKRIAMTLGFAGVALISYATYRGPSSRHSIRYYIQDNAFADTRVERAADEVIPSRAEASTPESSSGPSAVAPEDGTKLKAKIDIEKEWACFNSDELCPGYATGPTQHDYQEDVLTHMQHTAENEYYSLLRNPETKTAEHEAFARELITTQQQDLQLVGIKILELFEPSQENLEAISGCITSTLSEELFEQGMVVLNAKYGNNPSYVAQIRDMLEHQIQYGIDETTSHQAARELSQYLDRASFQHFLQLEQKLVPISKERYSALNSTLNEYAAEHHYQ